MSVIRASASGESRCLNETAGGLGMAGRPIMTATAASAPTAATNIIVPRQSVTPLMAVPIGEPRAVAALSPPKRIDRAVARFSVEPVRRPRPRRWG